MVQSMSDIEALLSVDAGKTPPGTVAFFQRDPEAASKRQQRTPQEQARYDNHVRHMIPLAQQLGYLRSAGFQGIDVYWKNLENVIYGGCRPTGQESRWKK